jgi:transketolase
MSEAQLDDLRRIVLRTINKNQILILTHIPRIPTSITSVLRELSKRYHIPLSTLKRNSQILRDLNLISYGEAPNFSGVEVTELGRFISGLMMSDEPTLLGNMVQTHSGFQPLGTVIKELRKRVLRMIAEAGSGHLGASLSAIEILTILYFMKMRHDPSNPEWPERDRIVLSKGHAAPALYAVLSEAGYLPLESLRTLRKLEGLPGHPEIKTPGVDASTGSLGQGLSIAVGMALAAKMDGARYRVYAILGDGELNEGQVWEAAATAAHNSLGNLTVIVDRNGYQLTGRTEDVKSFGSIIDKWSSFGWEAIEAEGHDPSAILEALDRCDMTIEQPSVVIARTTKGKGISFMEGNLFSRKAPNAKELKRALSELS